MHNRKVLLRIVCVALLLYALLNLLGVRHALAAAQRRREALQAELAALCEQQQLLEERMSAYGQDEEMRRLAWERLGMVAPGETVYIFPSGQEAPAGQR